MGLLRNAAVIDAAYALAATRQMCCADDITLLVRLLDTLPDWPLVVQLGAGSGTMGLAVMGARCDATLWSYDIDQQMLNWERQAFRNAGAGLFQQALEGHWRPRYNPRVEDSGSAGRKWRGCGVDLLIIDADHSYTGVIGDVGAWRQHASLIFLHDYDGTKAPQRYPGVRAACDELWPGQAPLRTGGWSAVFEGARATQHAAYRDPRCAPRLGFHWSDCACTGANR